MALLNKTLSVPTTAPIRRTQSQGAMNSPQAIVEDEISRYMRVEVSVCEYEDVHCWWGSSQQTLEFPCLSQVAGALFGMKPGSGGLECDIGSMGDVIGRRRGSLGPGMVEASMMIKLNKDRIVRDPLMVEEYRNTWKGFVPKRPDDPADYYDDPEEEEDADDVDNSSSDSNVDLDSDRIDRGSNRNVDVMELLDISEDED